MNRLERLTARVVDRDRVLAAAACLLLCLAARGALSRPLFENEGLYLPQLVRAVDPTELAGDWTIERQPSDRPLFDVVMRPLAMTGSFTTIAVVGRLMSWAAFAVAFVAFVRSLGLRRWWPAPVVFATWLLVFPYTVGSEWVVGTFEAKPFAYALLLTMAAAAGRRRPFVAGLAAGCAFSVHTVVGGWALLALLPVLVMTRHDRRQVGGSLLLGGLGALPGIVAVVRYLRPGEGTDADIRLVTRGVWGFHYDVTQFPPLRTAAFLVVLVAAGLLALARRDHERGVRTWQAVRALEVVTLVGLLAAVALRVVGVDRLLLPMPARLAPVVIPLAAWCRVLSMRQPSAPAGDRDRDLGTRPGRWSTNPPAASSWLGFAGAWLLALGTVAPTLHRPAERRAMLTQGWAGREDDRLRAYRWASQSLPTAVVVATDPTDAPFGDVHRPVVASYLAVAYNDLGGWQRRVEDLAGVALSWGDGEAERRSLSAGFRQRAPEAVLRWRERYGVTHVISDGRLPFDVLARFGSTAVYELPSVSAGDSATPAPAEGG